MSFKGLFTAIKYGTNLRFFKNSTEAEKMLFSFRDDRLTDLKNILNQNTDLSFAMNFSLESLKAIERLYFWLFEHGEFERRGINRGNFEDGMGIYFGEVIIRNNYSARWIVDKYPFNQNKYQLGIELGLGKFMIVDKCKDLCFREGNKRKQLLYRDYKKYFGR